MRPLCLAERLVGSAGVSLRSILEGSAGSLTGRSEFTLSDYVDEIMISGLPGVRRFGDRARGAQLDSYIERIVDHDLRESGHFIRRSATVLAWLRAYAAAVGTTATWERIRNAASAGDDHKPAKTTAIRYTELLTDVRILDPVDAWTPSRGHISRLTNAPKHYLADPALAVRLLHVSRRALLSGERGSASVMGDGALLGQLFESLAALTIKVTAQSSAASVFHLRTRDGLHEIDFVVEGDEGIVGIEAKLGATVSPSDFRHLRWLREQLGDRFIDGIIVTTGPEAYRDLTTGFGVVPLALLGR
jgi:uncharacterized protein